MKRILQRRELERGQSLVEMAIGSVILIIIVMGILDLGRVYFLNLTLEDAAAEGALYLSLFPDCPTEDRCPGKNNAEWRALNSADTDWTGATFTAEYCQSANLSSTSCTWTTTVPADPLDAGRLTQVRVTIQVPYYVLTPVVAPIVQGNSIMIGATATGLVVP